MAERKGETSAAFISHHENAQQKKAVVKFKLQYLNVQVTGLSVRLHPVLAWVLTQMLP
jgi:hypothetical protein